MPEPSDDPLSDPQRLTELLDVHGNDRATAEALGVTPQAVTMARRHHGIPVRRLWHRFDAETLAADLACGTYKSVAETYGTSVATVRRAAIRLRVGAYADLSDSSGPALPTDPDTLRRLYVRDGLSTNQIASLTRRDRKTISELLERAGIERRNAGRASANPSMLQTWREHPRLLANELLKHGTVEGVAGTHGVHGASVIYVMDRYGVHDLIVAQVGLDDPATVAQALLGASTMRGASARLQAPERTVRYALDTHHPTLDADALLRAPVDQIVAMHRTGGLSTDTIAARLHISTRTVDHTKTLMGLDDRNCAADRPTVATFVATAATTGTPAGVAEAFTLDEATTTELADTFGVDLSRLLATCTEGVRSQLDAGNLDGLLTYAGVPPAAVGALLTAYDLTAYDHDGLVQRHAAELAARAPSADWMPVPPT